MLQSGIALGCTTSRKQFADVPAITQHPLNRKISRPLNF